MTLLGSRIGSGNVIEDYPKLYARSGGGIDYPPEAFENYVRATGGLELANYVLGCHRGSYFPPSGGQQGFALNWPQNNTEARWERDAAAGRQIFFSAKASGGLTWAQVAAGSMDAQIDARGLQLLAFLLAHPTISMCFTFHHEPNNGDAADPAVSGSSNETQGITNWWRAMERICTRWDALGIPRAVVSQTGVISSRGMIYGGPNIAGAAQVSTAATYNAWYRTPATEPWGWGPTGIQMACFDMYQGGSGGGGVWRSFPEMAGANNSRPGFVQWAIPKIAQQNAVGLTLLLACWEFACDEWDKIWPEPSTRMFSSFSPDWNATGLAPTMANYFDHAGAYVEANPTLFYALILWDSSATSGGNPSGRGPHMFDAGAPTRRAIPAFPGTQEVSWEALLRLIKRPVFRHIAPPQPPGPFTQGAISLPSRLRQTT